LEQNEREMKTLLYRKAEGCDVEGLPKKIRVKTGKTLTKTQAIG